MTDSIPPAEVFDEPLFGVIDGTLELLLQREERTLLLVPSARWRKRKEPEHLEHGERPDLEIDRAGGHPADELVVLGVLVAKDEVCLADTDVILDFFLDFCVFISENKEK